MTVVRRLHQRVAQAAVEGQLWQPGQRILVAVSGGLDSVCLVDLLHLTVGLHGGVLEVGTVDHGVRPDSAEDAAFVVALAESRGLPAHRFDLQLGEAASEATCRQARYEALESVGADRLAVGHHADDQAETVLMQLCRGSGLQGIAGMRARRGHRVRPLLGVRRAELEAWAGYRGLRYREDPSNTDPRYTRNRVRAELMPLLESIWPGAGGRIARAGLRLGDDAAVIHALAEQAPPLPWDLTWARSTESAVLRRALLLRLEGLEHRHVAAILDVIRRGSGWVELPGGRGVGVRGGHLVCEGA